MKSLRHKRFTITPGRRWLRVVVRDGHAMASASRRAAVSIGSDAERASPFSTPDSAARTPRNAYCRGARYPPGPRLPLLGVTPRHAEEIIFCCPTILDSHVPFT